MQRRKEKHKEKSLKLLLELAKEMTQIISLVKIALEILKLFF